MTRPVFTSLNEYFTEWVFHWMSTSRLLLGSDHATCSILKQKKTLKSPVACILWSFFNNFIFYLFIVHLHFFIELPTCTSFASNMKFTQLKSLYIFDHPVIYAAGIKVLYFSKVICCLIHLSDLEWPTICKWLRANMLPHLLVGLGMAYQCKWLRANMLPHPLVGLRMACHM